MPTLNSATDSDGQPMHRRVTECLRQAILDGSLAQDVALPTMHELAKHFGTSYFTVQTALTPLVEEGLLERKRRVGTVVRHDAGVITRAAIYCGKGILGSSAYAFSRELVRCLQEHLAEQNVETEAFVDTRPQEGRSEALPALARAVAANEVQALFVVLCDNESLGWLRDLPVATSFTCSEPIANRVYCDHEQMQALALAHLQAQGCRTVGLISTIQNNPLMPVEANEKLFYTSFIDALGQAGLATRDAWIMVPDSWKPDLESYGYGRFRALWQQSERPDGLLVFPDAAARGVMTAALEVGARTPEDMHMVFHRNGGVNWLCPLPVHWAESDTDRWAREMILQVRRQKVGKPVEPVALKYVLKT